MNGTLEITTGVSSCIGCRYCPQDLLVERYFSTGGTRWLTFDGYRRMLQSVPLDVAIHFSGLSEPWLNPACTDMLLFAAERGHLISVYSTLLGMHPADLSRIKDVQFNYFVIHAPDREGNSRIPVNASHLDLLKRAFDTEFKVRSDYQISCHGSLHPAVAEILPERLRVYNYMLDRAGNLPYGDGVPEPLRGPIDCARAGRRINRNVLLPDGRVLLCCMDYGIQHTLGNLLEHTYAELLDGRGADSVRRAMDDDSIPLLCRKCVSAVKWNS